MCSLLHIVERLNSGGKPEWIGFQKRKTRSLWNYIVPTNVYGTQHWLCAKTGMLMKVLTKT